MGRRGTERRGACGKCGGVGEGCADGDVGLNERVDVDEEACDLRQAGVNVMKMLVAKEWSVMSCSAGVVGSAKKSDWFSVEKTILFAEKSTSDPAMSLKTRRRGQTTCGGSSG